MIFVTGGAGFIGCNFIRHWMESTQEDVLNLDALTYAGNLQSLEKYNADARYTFIHGNIKDRAHIVELLKKHKPRAILNFAAESHVDKSIAAPDEFLNTNIMGTYALLECTRNYLNQYPDRRECFRFLHVSTDEVYGSLCPNAPAFTEESPYLPNSAYSASKAASDHLVRAWHHTYGMPVLTTNCSNNYGPYQFPEKLIPLITTNAIAMKPLPIYGDGQQVRDWLFVDDHCKAICAVLEKGEPGETYNIGGSNELTNIELVKRICVILDNKQPRKDGRKYASQIEFVDDRPGHDQRYAINSSKIESKLGWQPLESFETGLVKTVDWYLENRSWVNDVIVTSKRT